MAENLRVTVPALRVLDRPLGTAQHYTPQLDFCTDLAALRAIALAAHFATQRYGLNNGLCVAVRTELVAMTVDRGVAARAGFCFHRAVEYGMLERTYLESFFAYQAYLQHTLKHKEPNSYEMNLARHRWAEHIARSIYEQIGA